MAERAYGGYLKHKIDQLWKEVEELKARVEKLESGPAPAGKPVAEQAAHPKLVPVKVEEGKVIPPVPVQEPAAGDPVLKLLKQNGPSNIVDINSALKKEGIEETVRDTLFNRVKVLMQKGVVEYDEETQRFSAS